MKFIKTNAQLIAACAYLLVVGFFAFFGNLAVPPEQWDNIANAGWALVPSFMCYVLFQGAQLLRELRSKVDADTWAVRTATKINRQNR